MSKLHSKNTKKTVNPVLAHDEFFNALRATNYKRLDKDNHIYMDYTGGNLYSTTQLEEHLQLLSNNTFGNPHSTNPTSSFSTKLVEEARERIIEFFNAEDYFCVFTANASGALKIVGECYPFEDDGHFALFTDNHNSVNGIREYCVSVGGELDTIKMNVEDLSVSGDDLMKSLKGSTKKNRLLAYPAQSNVSGIKHDLKWIAKAQDLGWDVLLDAAAFVPTSILDLKKYTPDYVSVSFYKIFGYPTGLGCLLIKKSSFSKLHKKWFAGGTVKFASAKVAYHFLNDNHERFENGTLNYLDIPALKIGLDYIDSIGMMRLNERVASLMEYLCMNLRDLRHSNGVKQLHIFGHPARKNTGGTMIMSFINSDGSKIEFEVVDEFANESKISLRSGCFCNPGLDETTNCIGTEEIATYFKNRDPNEYVDIIEQLKRMRGATRISVGIATVKSDLDAFVSFVKSFKDKIIN